MAVALHLGKFPHEVRKMPVEDAMGILAFIHLTQRSGPH
jgi:hypothetical protein